MKTQCGDMGIYKIDHEGLTEADKSMEIWATSDTNNDTYKYKIQFKDKNGYTLSNVIQFQHGPIKEFGVNGITSESLLAVLIHRLEVFQSSPYACKENQISLDHLKKALESMHNRTRERMNRNVEGTKQI